MSQAQLGGIIMKHLTGKKRGHLNVLVKSGRKMGLIGVKNLKAWFLVHLRNLYLPPGGLSVVFVLVLVYR